MIKEFKERLGIIMAILFLLFSILLIRVTYLTFFNGNLSEIKNEYRVKRGVIYDRRGLELALSQDSSTVGINPAKIYDSNFTATKLSKYVNIDSEKIETMILEKPNYFLLKREIDNLVAGKISEMSLPGVRIEKEYKRIYPNGTLASNLIGFTGRDDNQSISGIELNFHRELQTYTDTETLRGNDIYLTIDSLVQYRLETALGKAFKETRSKKAVGVFLDVHTGKVIAMASFPNYDPNKYNDYPVTDTTNWAIRYEYEPGSTMKIFMAMILLNENLIDLNEKFFCPGFVEFGSRRVNCGEKHDMVDLDEILQHSCNVGMIKAIKKVPDKVLYKYMKQFHFGSKTGILQDELKGKLPSIKDWTPSTSYYMAIGQGFSVTPIQLVSAAASLVNGGKVIIPTVLSHITNSYGEVIKQSLAQSDSLDLKDEIGGQIMRAMTKVVKLGTGQRAFTQSIGIAGKTGTSQVSVKGKGYQEGLFNASFIGFFPAEKPQIVGLILLSEPESFLHSGGSIAAPVFKEVVENIIPIVEFTENPISYQLKDVNIESSKLDKNLVPDFSGKSLKESLLILKKFNTKYKIHGSGFNVKQNPEKNSKFNDDETWELFFKPD